MSLQKMEKFDWKMTIQRNIFLLKITGLWPPGNTNYGGNLYTAYATMSIIPFICGHNFFQAINIFFIYPDLEAISGTIFVTLSEILTIVKTYYVVQNMGILKQLMVDINIDIFQPRNHRQLEMIQPSLKFWKIASTLLYSMSSAAIFFWATYPILDGSVKERRLPFLAWYPYNTTVTPNYQITYVYQMLSVSIIASSTLCIDTLIAALNMFVGAQCDILCDNLRNLTNSTDFGSELVNCIKHHKQILRFADDTNKFYNLIVLAQFFISSATIGIIMFQVTLVKPLTSEFFSLVTFGIAVITEIFMYCWFGNEAQVKSDNIPEAIFASDWSNADVPLHVKKHVVFFLMNTQRSVKMSALNLFYLTLETFVKILRMSWSYFAILQQANTRK